MPGAKSELRGLHTHVLQTHCKPQYQEQLLYCVGLCTAMWVFHSAHPPSTLCCFSLCAEF